jgi:hypothetical protein
LLSDAIVSPTCGIAASHAGTTAFCGGWAFLRGDFLLATAGGLGSTLAAAKDDVLAKAGASGATIAAALLLLRVLPLRPGGFYWV